MLLCENAGFPKNNPKIIPETPTDLKFGTVVQKVRKIRESY